MASSTKGKSGALTVELKKKILPFETLVLRFSNSEQTKMFRLRGYLECIGESV